MIDPLLPQDLTRDAAVRLVTDGEHLEVVDAVQLAQASVRIATANLKDLHVDAGKRPRGGRHYRSMLEVFDALAERGVSLRVLHAAPPSGPFRERFDALPRLVAGGLELRQCPRVHLKAVVVDDALVYLGSANWTGAGLGAKADTRRNFELGVLSADAGLVAAVGGRFDALWGGAECGACGRRELCPGPLDL